MEPEPPAPPDPGPDPPTVPADPTPAWEPRPALDGIQAARLLPQWPRYRRPARGEYDWVIDAAGWGRSKRGLHDVAPDPDSNGVEGGVIGHCYRASRAAGHEGPVVVGIIDRGKPCAVGGQWNPHAGRSVVASAEEPIDLVLVGLTPHAEVELTWGPRYAQVRTLRVFDLGIRGGPDSFIVNGGFPVGSVILDGCWLLAREGQMHASGLHVRRCSEFVLRGLQWRGKTPEDAGVTVREHALYCKDRLGDLWVVESDLRGGNRTGCQVRPGADDPQDVRPKGAVVMAANRFEGFGRNHPPEHSAGGGALTLWSSPDDPVFVLGNEVKDARYGCLMLNGQGAHRNWLNADGYPIHSAYIEGNALENRSGDRAAVALTSVGKLYIGPNVIQSRHGQELVLNDGFLTHHAIPNGQVRFYGHTPPIALLGRLEGGAYSTRRASLEELASMTRETLDRAMEDPVG